MKLRALTSFEQQRIDVAAIWDPAQPSLAKARPTTSDAIERQRATTPVGDDVEGAIVSIATRPLASHETIQSGNDAREHELATLFSRLTIVEARELGRRLDRAYEDDNVVRAFERLVPARRERLRRYLADAPRRNAIRR